MRFRSLPRFEWSDTSRKRAAVRRRLRLECEAVPLFAALVAETQPSVDVVMADRAARHVTWEREQRAHRAAQWRRGRAMLAALPVELRAAVLAYWNGHRGLPGDPGYLIGTVSSVERGKLVRDDVAGFRFARVGTASVEWESVQRYARSNPALPISG